MFAPPEFLVAQPIRDLLGLDDRREGLRVLIASLARGGAERIVLEWLAAEARRGRRIELAILHARRTDWRAPSGIETLVRDGESPEGFVEALARRWSGGAPVSAHLVGDDLLAILWRAGIATIPTVHNAREGWRNDPSSWEVRNVPAAIACAESVRAQMHESGCRVPVITIRHVPAPHRAATDPAQRSRIRSQWGIAPETLLIGAVGAFKAQKDFPRAIEILARVRSTRAAELVILGGVLDAAQLAELDRTLERIASLGLSGRVKLPGFVDPIGPWYAACDVILSASRYEGLSMAAREALAAGLPVVALDVGGQGEIGHRRLTLMPSRASGDSIAAELARIAVRERLEAEPVERSPRVWSVACGWRPQEVPSLDTLFVTANLNAGGAQRSLVNLATSIGGRHRVAVAVCGETTQDAFVTALGHARIRCFRPAPAPDPFALAESLLAEAHRTAVATVCFWNADPRVKLLVTKFAPPTLRLVDASPGAYAFEEMERERAFAATITFPVAAYYERLDLLVLKHHAKVYPRCASVRVIPNGVAIAAATSRRPDPPRFVVSGRIAPSKRLETIVAAFAQARGSLGCGELHIVGQAEPRHARYGADLLAAAGELPVRFRGALPALEHLSEDFTAAIVLGTNQGSPNAVLEAMAAGIPVIANASGGTAELVRDGDTGWLIPEDAGVEALATALVECASRPERADALAERARALVQRDFSLDSMVERYLECFAGPVS